MLAAGVVFSLLAVAQLAATQLPPPQEAPRQALSDLITANHILHHRSIIDSFGHVSIRHPNDSSVYIMAASAGNTVSRAADLYYYRVNDSEPLPFPNGTMPGSVSARSERFIHGEIMRRYSETNAVVHSHALPMLTYATGLISLVPVYHMAAFMGLNVPLWDITPLYNSTERQDMLVNNARFGSALAAAFSNSTSTSDNPSTLPTYPLVLQRYHGFSTAATSLSNVVYQSIYATDNAVVETAQLEARRAVGGEALGSIEALSLNEVQTSTGLGADDYAFRAWEGFAWEVQHLSDYVNELR
ncbi:hypothetical protein LTR05_005717 [Lithohypha guttulata]|uniref:Class II aldolase/adducin N-terminal domain-containing protein n=1 Tax=Lithohypha guttulata TaxID=1690604 RepID=A0AAN7Y667_9EURO|nr:hypothetical protein LTR05_005717 [Lithohypha guttulata]